MYKVYLNNIEQNEEDIINITELASFSILREDSITSTEQIIRETSEMELNFCGATYCYLVDKLAKDRCAEVDFHIEDSETGLSYNGVIPMMLLVLNPHSKTGSTKIKDTSFSAYIRDVMDVSVSLSARTALGCSSITSIDRRIRFITSHTATTPEVQVLSFDVLDALQMLVSYFTNNTIEVRSDYLTTNKYAITTGFNLHSWGSSQDEIYPTVTISDLYTELRKKLRLFMSVDMFNSGQPYLRIEPESYFFSNTTPLLTIDEVPFDTSQQVDLERSYSRVKVGSSIIMDGDGEYFPNAHYESFREEEYGNCSTCFAKKESVLDLVSDYIIDSNVIYDLLNAGLVDNDNDDNIVLFAYSGDITKRTLIGSEYVYNDSLRNKNVLNRLSGDVGGCLTLARYPSSGFYLEEPNAGFTGPTSYLGGEDMMSFTNIVYDNFNTITYDATPDVVTLPPNVYNGVSHTISQARTYFTAPVSGTYSFKAVLTNFLQTVGALPCDLDVELQIVKYTDNTQTTYNAVYNSIGSTPNSLTTAVNISLSTGNVAMTAGETMCVIFSLYDKSGVLPLLDPVEFRGGLSFEMLGDGTCQNIEYVDQDTKPFVIEFDYPLCQQDYQTIRDNKIGYITVKGQRFWIKELEFKPFALSHFVLIGNNSIA